MKTDPHVELPDGSRDILMEELENAREETQARVRDMEKVLDDARVRLENAQERLREAQEFTAKLSNQIGEVYAWWCSEARQRSKEGAGDE